MSTWCFLFRLSYSIPGVIFIFQLGMFIETIAMLLGSGLFGAITTRYRATVNCTALNNNTVYSNSTTTAASTTAAPDDLEMQRLAVSCCNVNAHLNARK